MTFILFTTLAYGTYAGGFSEPRQMEGYFPTRSACDQRGNELFLLPRSDDMVRMWECVPEQSNR